MKVIADDEEDSSIILGGGITPEEKSEYMKAYYGIIISRKSGDKEKEKEFADILLESLHTYLVKEIDDLSNNEKESERLKEEGYTIEKIPTMLFTPPEIEVMREDIRKIWASIDPDETDHILKVNLVSIQCSFLFTKYSKNRDAPGKFNKRYDEIPEPPEGGDYTDYNFFKQNLKGLTEYVYGYTNKDGQLETYYLINMLPYISITDMLETWLYEGIWLVGFSTRFQYTDGNNWNSPINFLYHDYEHADNTFFCYDVVFGGMSRDKKKENKIRTYTLIKEFYNYCKTTYDVDKVKLYSIKLLLFTAFHEIGHQCLSYFSNASDIEQLKRSLWGGQQVTFATRFSDKNDLFLSLPTRIKNAAKDPETNTIDREIIKKYFLEEAIPNYAIAINEFQRTKGMLSGGRKTKRYIKRNKKTSKKRRRISKARK
jgi:hypothetical protein